MEYKKTKGKGIRRDPTKVSNDLGDVIYKGSSERLQENLKKGEIIY